MQSAFDSNFCLDFIRFHKCGLVQSKIDYGRSEEEAAHKRVVLNLIISNLQSCLVYALDSFISGLETKYVALLPYTHHDGLSSTSLLFPS